MDMKKTKFSVGALFSGIGGIEKGFKDAGYSIEWANEFDANACKTYRLNNKNTHLIEGDLLEIDPGSLNPVDILVGGFPCQAFSVAGYQKGFDDPRGNLFFAITRMIKKLPEKPKAFMLENVKNLVGHDKGKTFKVIRKELEKLGYSFFWKVLNTSDYTDIPQNRERTIMVGFRDELDWEFNPNAIASQVFDQHFPPPKVNKLHHIREFLEKEKVDEKFYYRENAYMYNELVKSVISTDTVYQWRRVYVRENKSDMCPTLTANMGTGGHNVPLIKDKWGIRKLTPRECFRFQGFSDIELPDDVAQSQLYKQAGNSVTVPLMKAVALQIKKALQEKYL